MCNDPESLVPDNEAKNDSIEETMVEDSHMMIDGAVVHMSVLLCRHSIESVKLTIHILLDTLVRQYAPPIHIYLIPNGHIIPQHAHILQPCPPANAAVPTNNRTLDPRMVLDLAARQQHTPLYPHAIADDDIGANSDIGTDAAILADLG